MSAQCEVTAKVAARAPLTFFERYLTLWVFLCILAGIGAGQLFPAPFQAWAAWSWPRSTCRWGC